MTVMFSQERSEVARFMRRLYQQRLTTTSGGNLSWRVADNSVLLTASGSDKGTLTGDQVLVLDMNGNNATPELKPSIESRMHLEIYRRHEEVQAIVHAHPIMASAFCATERQINCRLIAESYAIVGEPVLLPYATMGSEELANVVAEGVGKASCVLLANHGVLTVGRSLLQAFDRLEVLEAAAHVTLITELLGGGRELDHDMTAALDGMLGRRIGSVETGVEGPR